VYVKKLEMKTAIIKKLMNLYPIIRKLNLAIHFAQIVRKNFIPIISKKK